MLKKIKENLIILCATLVINLLLFTSIPLLSEIKDRERATEYLGRPTVVSYHEPEPGQEQEEPQSEDKPEEEEPEALVQEPILPKPRTVSRPKMDLDIRPPDFRLSELEVGSLEIEPAGQELPISPQQEMSEPGDVFSIGEVDRHPRLISKINPVYPFQARRQNITGRVILKFLVDTRGRVKKLSVVRASPAGVFEESAIEAVKKWRFEPGTIKGEPVKTWVRVPIKFELSGK